MPKIGRIDVPDSLFEKLLLDAATAFMAEVVELAKLELNINLSEHKSLTDDSTRPVSQYLWDCLLAIVRVQIDDYISDAQTIRNSDDFRQVAHYIYSLADQIGYKALPEGHLKALVDNNLDSFQTLLS